MIIVKKPGRARRRWAIVLAILAILLALSAFVGWRALELRQQLVRGRDELGSAVAAATKKPLLELDRDDLKVAVEHLRRAEEILRPARAELGRWEWPLGVAGGDLAAVLPLADTALEAATAGQQLYSGLEPLLDRILATTGSKTPSTEGGSIAGTGTNSGLLGQWQGERLNDLVRQLRAGQPAIRRAQEHLRLALIAYGRIDKEHLSGDVAASVAELDKYARYLQSAHDLTGAIVSAPDLLTSIAGLDRSKTYLLLGQNNDELRPTGGAIGTFGLLVVRDGTIVVHSYSSTAKAYLKAPVEPCPEASPPWWIKLKDPAWACWDAQWTADFPTLARQAKWFYEQGRNDYAPVDGVIAIDQLAFELLLGALGPVQLSGDTEEVTAANFRSRVYLRPNSEEPEPHKQFLAKLFQAIIGRDLEQINPDRASALVTALYKAIERKHILFYFEDVGLQDLAALLRVDGSIQASRGDYLFVVDTSLYDKVYGSVVEQIDYEARLASDGGANARTTITWTYSATAAAKDAAIIKAAERRGQTPFLLDLTRVYLPKTTVWQSLQGDSTSAYFGVEADRLLAGTRVDVGVGEQKQVTYKYLTPSVVETVGDEQRYRLLVQKQPGTRGATLLVRISLPPGAQLISTAPNTGSIAMGALTTVTTVEFRTQLTIDRTFEVAFRQAAALRSGK